MASITQDRFWNALGQDDDEWLAESVGPWVVQWTEAEVEKGGGSECGAVLRRLKMDRSVASGGLRLAKQADELADGRLRLTCLPATNAGDPGGATGRIWHIDIEWVGGRCFVDPIYIRDVPVVRRLELYDGTPEDWSMPLSDGSAGEES